MIFFYCVGGSICDESNICQILDTSQNIFIFIKISYLPSLAVIQDSKDAQSFACRKFLRNYLNLNTIFTHFYLGLIFLNINLRTINVKNIQEHICWVNLFNNMLVKRIYSFHRKITKLNKNAIKYYTFRDIGKIMKRWK